MKTKIYRTTDLTHERLHEICFALSQSFGKKVSETMIINRALNYYLDNELYHNGLERQKFSTGKDLQEK